MDLFKNIIEVVQKGNYALRPHAVSHMLSEGFDESNIIEAITKGKIIENYIDEDRCLIAGKFQLTEKTKESLHAVIDYWSESEVIEWVDIVTAYIPRLPFWKTLYLRGERKK